MAPTKSIVGGNFQDALGNLITGNLLLVLPVDAQIPGGGPLAPVHIRIPVNGGAVASTPIWFNDQLQPGNTAYIATVYDSTGNRVYGPELWALTGASPFNLSTIVPLLISPDPLFSSPVLQNPVSPQTITGQSLTLTNTAPLTVQGALAVSGAASFASTTVAATIGPVVGQQHTLPAVASDTIALLAAVQSFSNKTLVSPIIGGTGAVTTPTDTSFTFTAGNGVSVGGGSFAAVAGNSSIGSTGFITLTSGSGTGSNLPGGNITFSPGAGNGSGANGIVQISASRLFYPSSFTQATLGTPSNGAVVYCSDCTIANPCAAAGTGAIAKRLNGVWVCN